MISSRGRVFVMKLHKDMKVVACCRAGQVRSVSARFILVDFHDFHKVLTCGLEKNDYDTLKHLFDWADIILIVGSPVLWIMAEPLGCQHKSIHLNVGKDRWGYFQHQELVTILVPMIAKLMSEDFSPPMGIALGG